MAKISGGELAAKALVNQGVEIIFTLSGGHITPIYQHLENTDVRLFDTRHEQAAGFMAEAYGRMNRKPGVAMVTAGPGFTNVLTPVANARQANSPLLIISGCVGVSSSEKLDLQDMTQAAIIEPMVKKTFVCHTTSRIPTFVDMAYRTAISGRPGPVYLEIPVDVLNAEVEASSVQFPKTQLVSKPVDLEGAAKLMELVGQSQRPVIMAGNGAWYADAGEELKKFAETANIPVFTAGLSRGLLPDSHPLCFESSIGVRPGATLTAQAMADTVIFLGNRLSLFYMFGALISPTAKLVQVDIQSEEIGRNRSIDLPINSDISALLGECNRIIERGKLAAELSQRFAGWVTELQGAHEMGKSLEASNWNSDNVPIHPLRLAKEVNDFMNRDTDVVVADGGDTQVWMGMTRTAKLPGHYLDSGLYGCLGVGLPFANAAQLQYPDSRVCLIIGDGSVGFNFMEFETALRKKLPIVVVVSNDLGWGMIRHSQELRMGHAIADGTWIGEVPYQKMIEGLGGVGFFVTKAEDVKAAMEAAFASGKPALINVMTDPTTISPGSIALANVGAYGQG
jgi:acetolactate synthase-1/2/3 large subunit